MTTDIGNLAIKVDATDVSKGTQAVDELAIAAEKAEKEAFKLGGTIGTALKLGITTAIATTIALTKSAIDAADAMNDMHLKTGLAFKDLAAYDLLARQSGTSIEGMAHGFRFLGKYITEHGDKLKEIGVTSKDSNIAMQQFADVIAGIQDPALKSTLAMQVLGRSGVELIPALSGGAEAFKKAQEESDAYGKMLEKVAPKADAFNDNMARIAISGKIVGLTLAEKMLPTLQALSEELIKSSENGGVVERWGNTATTVLKGLAVAALYVARGFDEVGSRIGGNLAKTKAILSGDFAGASAIGERMREDNKARGEEYNRMITSILNAGTALDTNTPKVEKNNKALEDSVRKMLDRKNAVDAHQKSVDSFIKSLEKEVAVFGMSQAQQKEYEAGLLKMKPTEMSRVHSLTMALELKEREKKIEDEVKKIADDRINKINSETESLNKKVDAMQFEVSTIGKTKEEIAALEVARTDHLLAIDKEKLAILESANVTTAESEALRENIRMREKLRAIEGVKTTALGFEELKKSSDELNKIREKIAVTGAERATQAEFENAKIGKSALEVEKLTIAYQAQRNELIKLNEISKNKTMNEADRARAVEAVHAETNAVIQDAAAQIAARERLNKSWGIGATIAMNTYIDSVAKASQESEKLMSMAFKGIEDALVKFVETGKLSVRSLFDSMIADLIRWQIQQATSSLIKGASSALGGSGFDLGSMAMSAMASIFGGGFGGTRAIGGGIEQNQPYLVGERGPEIIIPKVAGTVMPNVTTQSQAQQQQQTNVVVNFTVAQPLDRATQEQTAAMMGFAIQNAMKRNG